MCEPLRPVCACLRAGEAGTAAAASPEEALRAQVTALQTEVKELKEDRLRLLAEMENVRAIARRDVETTRNYAIQSFAKQLLDVADTLGMAIDSVPDTELTHTQLKNLHEGVSMTRTSLLKLFNAQGMKEVCIQFVYV